VGVNNTFISIYESNSWDATKPLLSQLDHTLNTLDLPHRIVSRDDEARWWPYGTSPERINFLARARNQALLPLQSSDPQTRLEEYDQFTKVIFLNDVQFTWESIVRLVATRVDGDESKAGDYDLACGIDYASSGESCQSYQRQ